MNKPKTSSKPRTLELKKETVVRLTEAMLETVVGGKKDGNSGHLSMCDSKCVTQ